MTRKMYYSIGDTIKLFWGKLERMDMHKMYIYIYIEREREREREYFYNIYNIYIKIVHERTE